MKRTIFIGILMIFTMTTSMAFAGRTNLKSATENTTVSVKADNKMSAEELSILKARVEEIRAMDKSSLTSAEKRELRTELKGIKTNVRRSGEVIYIGGSTLLLIIILILIL